MSYGLYVGNWETISHEVDATLKGNCGRSHCQFTGEQKFAGVHHPGESHRGILDVDGVFVLDDLSVPVRVQNQFA